MGVYFQDRFYYAMNTQSAVYTRTVSNTPANGDLTCSDTGATGLGFNVVGAVVTADGYVCQMKRF